MERPVTGRSLERPGADLLALAVLMAATVIVGLPALRGDLLAYVDIPVHVREAADLALPGSRGWTDLGFCGFPLHILQSPFVYGGLALLARRGLSLATVFEVVTVAAMVMPAFAVYGVVRRRLGVTWSLVAAASLFFYRGAIIGTTSSLGGMFGFHIAAAFLVVALDRLARPTRRLRDVAVLAALVATVGLLHMWVTFALVLLGAIHFAWSVRTREGRERLLFDVPALALGALAAAVYWLPSVLVRPPITTEPSPLQMLIKRFFTIGPAVMRPGASLIARWHADPVHGVDALVQAAVLLAAVVGFRKMLRSDDRNAHYGAAFAGAIAALLALASLTGLPLLGPQGFRLIYVMKMGVVLACVPFLASLEGPRVRARFAPLALVASGILAFACVMERLPASVAIAPSSPAVAETERLWSWIREHKSASWGRVAIEDTMGDLSPAREGVDDDALLESHLLVQTAARTGVEQVGAYFTALPLATEELVASEGGKILGLRAQRAGFMDNLVSRMQRTNATHLVLADAPSAARVARDGRFALEHEEGRYHVFCLRGAESRWAQTLGGSAVDLERVAPGRMRVTLTGPHPSAPLFVSESYHRFWRAEPPDAATLHSTDDGLMVVEPSGESRSFELVYDPPRFPLFLSIGAMLTIVGLFATDELRRRASLASRPALRPSAPSLDPDLG